MTLTPEQALEHGRPIEAEEPGGAALERGLLHRGEATDRLGEINIVAFGRLVREPGEPDDEQEHAGQQSHRHGADHDIVRSGLHQAVTS